MAYFSVSGLFLRRDGKELLHDISFEVEKGTLTLIAGRNGSGKSMLLKAIKGLEKYDEGKIVLAGDEIRKSRDRMRRIGLVFQDAALEIVGSTLRKDIAFGLENQGLAEDDIAKITDRMLHEFSIEDKADCSPAILSGGEKRKLCIAGVLAMSTELLLLDEPFANLDYPSAKTVLRTLLDLKKKGETLIIVSHEAEKIAAHTDNIIILKDGRIKEKGPSEDMVDLLMENDIYIPANVPFEELTWLR